MYKLKSTYDTGSTCTQERKNREIVRMSRKLADRENKPQETILDEGDSESSLERDLPYAIQVAAKRIVSIPPTTRRSGKIAKKRSQYSDHSNSTDVPKNYSVDFHRYFQLMNKYSNCVSALITFILRNILLISIMTLMINQN